MYLTSSSDTSARAKTYQCFVWRVEQRAVLVKCPRALRSVPAVDVSFGLNRVNLRHTHQGLGLFFERHTCPESVLLPASPLPRRAPLLPVDPADPLDGDLNADQRRAVAGILRGECRPAPFLVYGPPGTGKTRTLAAAVRLLLQRRPDARVLVLAPSNSAADELLRRLVAPPACSGVLRLMCAGRGLQEVDAEVRVHCHVEEGCFTVPPLPKLEGYSLVVSTLSMAARLHNHGLPAGHFDAVLVDEAGHCFEAEVVAALGGLLLPEGERGEQLVVLAGDPQQLGPIVRSSLGEKHGLDVSLLARLATTPAYSRSGAGAYDPACIVKLTHCYRCHPDILRLPNALFYHGDLVSAADPALTHRLLAWEALPNPAFPLLFHGVDGEAVREGSSPSWFNVAEVEQCVAHVGSLLCMPGVLPRDIGIISPYRKQVAKLRQALAAAGCVLGEGGVLVGSVEQFQGQERLAIILSTVRSQPDLIARADTPYSLGFVSSPKRFNVGLTRAQALCVVVGSPRVLREDPHWGQLLALCAANNSCLGVPPPPQEEDFQLDDGGSEASEEGDGQLLGGAGLEDDSETLLFERLNINEEYAL